MEILDICNEEGIPTGKTVDRETAHREAIRHRTAHVWIMRNQNGRIQVLLQKRSMNKDSFPGMYDTSSAGHIPAGDEPKESACRELQEELGITASETDLIPVGKFRIRYDEVFRGKMFRDNEVTFVYILNLPVTDEMITVQEEEIESTAWFDLKEVFDECMAGSTRFCVDPDGLKLLKQYLISQDKWDD